MALCTRAEAYHTRNAVYQLQAAAARSALETLYGRDQGFVFSYPSALSGTFSAQEAEKHVS